MKKVSLLIYEDVALSAVAGTIDLLEGVNRILRESGRQPAFRLELVSEKVKNIGSDVRAQFLCHTTIEEVVATDLIIVPAFGADNKTVLQKNVTIINWIKKMHSLGTEVASLCMGSFFLAEAGLLDGKTATSHWMATDEMQLRYPRINVKSDKVITDEDGIYTSGGAFSSLRLLLYLIQKFCGRELALIVSKRFSIDFENINQAHFAVFTGQHQHGDDEILMTQQFIEQNYTSNISIEQVSALTSTSKRNFLRKFKAATNNTPIEYLQRVRMEAAKNALEDKEQNIDDVMLITGYRDIKTFRMIFKRVTGLTPLEYRKKYSKPLNTV